jgi:hypothetical protein
VLDCKHVLPALPSYGTQSRDAQELSSPLLMLVVKDS